MVHLSQLSSLPEVIPPFEAFCQTAGPPPVPSAVVVLRALSSAGGWEAFHVAVGQCSDSLPSPGGDHSITELQGLEETLQSSLSPTPMQRGLHAAGSGTMLPFQPHGSCALQEVHVLLLPAWFQQ